jgi:hypothetical protein
MEIEFAKGGEIDWNDNDTYKRNISYLKFCDRIACEEWSSTDNGAIYSNNENIVDNFMKENEEELKAYFKWMQEYNSWKGEK